jgi:vancomycin permeability regulator SanA
MAVSLKAVPFRVARRWRLVLGVAAAALLLATAMLVLDGLHDRLGQAEVGLVLGSKVELDGAPSPRLRARLEKTVELFQAGYFPLVIASGGVGREGFDEANVMRDYLVAHGIPDDAILVDGTGVTTYASALATARIVRERRLKGVFVVSQYFHLPRARLALRRFGMEPIYSAAPRHFEWRDLYSAPRELIGYVSYSLRKFDPAAPARD